jgi:hypothetical protein
MDKERCLLSGQDAASAGVLEEPVQGALQTQWPNRWSAKMRCRRVCGRRWTGSGF